MSSVPEDYHNFVDMFSKYKAGKIADHQLYNLNRTLDEGTALPFSPINSLSQEELAALHKFIDENLTKGSSIPLIHLMDLQPSSSRKRMALFSFALTSEALTRFPRKTDTHSHSSL